MILSFTKGVAQGIGIIVGIMICLMLMQWSVYLLERMELIETQQQKIEKFNKEYEREGRKFREEYGLQFQPRDSKGR